MENNALLILLESVLGKGQVTSKNNYAFKCPFCLHHKPKLEVNLRTTAKLENFWHCWICDFKGKTIKSLFKKKNLELRFQYLICKFDENLQIMFLVFLNEILIRLG